MKNRQIITFGIFCICTLFFVQHTFSAERQNPEGVKTSYAKIVLPLLTKEKKLEFGISEISRNAKERGLEVLTPKAKKGNDVGTITVNIDSDALQLDATIQK